MGWRRMAVVALSMTAGCGNATVRTGDAAAARPAADASPETVAVALPDARGHRDAPGDAPADASPEAAGDTVPAGATWTAIYQNLLVNTSYASNCTGSACHDPGTQKGIDLSTREQGYATIKTRLVPGSPDTSTLVIVLQSGAMPRGRPQMPAADIDLIRAWIQAGAPDN